MAAPFIGAFLVLVLMTSGVGYGFLLGMALISLTPIIGAGFAIAACIREERLRSLWWIGLIINFAAILFLVTNGGRLFGSYG